MFTPKKMARFKRNIIALMSKKSKKFSSFFPYPTPKMSITRSSLTIVPLKFLIYFSPCRIRLTVPFKNSLNHLIFLYMPTNYRYLQLSSTSGLDF